MGIEYSWLQYVIPPVVLLAVIAGLIVYVWPDKKDKDKDKGKDEDAEEKPEKTELAIGEERARVLRRIQG
jgi:hypothetical protein